MCSQLNSFSTFMGFPDSSPLFLSQKDTQFAMENEWKLLFRPSLEELQDACQIAPSEDKRVAENDQDQQGQGQGQEQEQEHEQERSDQVLLEIAPSSLKVKLPSESEGKVGEEEASGCKTPTSADQKIPLVCPPPPRKPKTLPSTKKKGSRRRVFLDLSDEIESLFPPALLADFGNKIKKVRKESFII